MRDELRLEVLSAVQRRSRLAALWDNADKLLRHVKLWFTPMGDPTRVALRQRKSGDGGVPHRVLCHFKAHDWLVFLFAWLSEGAFGEAALLALMRR